MSIRRILGDLPLARFINRHYLQQPLAQRGTARDLCALAGWPMLERILRDPQADVLLARQGQLHAGSPDRAPTLEEIRKLYDEGYTVLVRHAERHDDALCRLARGFADDFAAEVNIHIYLTPDRQYGFGWHYDAEEVFIIQTEGRKEYSLRKNTVHPWPLVETIPRNMAFERERMPLMRCALEAGDWLYIPAGYWHVAQSERAAASLAIGVMPQAAIHVLDALRPRLLQDLPWRHRLPCAGGAATLTEDELLAHYQFVFAQLGKDLQRQLTDESFLRSFIRSFRPGQPTAADEGPPHA